MPGLVWVIGAGTVIFGGVIAYAVTRRYGWGLAILLPVLALVALIAMRWQKLGLPADEGARMAGSMLLFAAPMLLGVVAGVALARIRRG